MDSRDVTNLIERFHAAGKQSVLAITGGGSSAIAALLEVPGASASVLEAVVPYAETALAQWLGGRPDHACSEWTARAMAMAAFERARSLSDADPRTFRGIGVTASLATTRPKRGPHRAHVAWQSASATVAISCELATGQRTRAEEERVVTALVLDAVAEACEVEAPQLTDPAIRNQVRRREKQAPQEWTELLLGQRSMIAVQRRDSANSAATSRAGEPPVPAVLFPGAFHPIHVGHERMADIAARRYQAPVALELSITNVDKPPLDFIELDDRLHPLAAWDVFVTRAATFADKARLAPGAVFVVGADTIARIADPLYYAGDATRRDAAIATIAEQGCRFLVFGRLLAGQFQTLADLDLPQQLQSLCDEVAETSFRFDASSSELRSRWESPF
ncbi:MAG: hypothetical protein L0Z07_01115 [Planctomycetes bacterium]|nr:hypothetical protein [Planctomycetota bacterium]